MWIDRIEKTVNERSDDDASWWPFLWMRPKKHEPLSVARLAMLALLYGIPSGAVAALALVLSGARTSAPLAVLLFPLIFFSIGSAVIAPMWNRRAVRLQRRR